MNKNNLEKKLESIDIKNLSDKEQADIWQSIQTNIDTPVSPFSCLLLTHKNMIQVIATVMIIALSSFGIVKAADNAKPGDFLFPLDRAIEDIQIKITPKDKKDKLKIKFALERVEEISILLKSAGPIAQSTSTPPVATSTLPVNATSTPTSTGSVVPSDDKISQAIQIAIDYIEKVKNEMEQKGNMQAATALKDIADSLKSGQKNIGRFEMEIEKEDDKNKFKIEIKGDRKQKIEIESEDGQIKIKNKIKKYKPEDDEFEDANRFILSVPASPTSTPTTTPNPNIVFKKVKIKLYQNSSKIEIKTNKGEVEFTLETADIDEIKNYIISKYNISNLDDILKTEFEDDEDDEKTFKYDDKSRDGIFIPVNPSQPATSSTPTTDYLSSPDDNTPQSYLRKAEVEIKNKYSEIKIQTPEDEYEFSLNTTDRDKIIQYISATYNIPLEEVSLKTKFKEIKKDEEEKNNQDDEDE